MDIEQLEEYVASRCVTNYDYGLFVRILVVCQFFPLFLTIGMYAITLAYRYRELYYSFFSFGLTLNWLLNWGLQEAIGIKPRIPGCGSGYSMPSWHSQHVFFFYVMVMTYFLLQRKRIGIFNLVLLNCIPALVCASRMSLGFSTFGELLIGSVIGVSFGFLYQCVLLRWIKPRIPRLMEWRILQKLGYTDHFFFSDQKNESEFNFPISPAGCVFCQMRILHQLHF